MPTYEYVCQSCNVDFEALRPIASRDRASCPECGSPKTKRQVTACHFVMRESGTVRKLSDRIKFESDAKADLSENYGVAKINPLGGSSISTIYQDVKQQGSFVKDKMQQSTAENTKKTKDKQREWAREALKRTPERSKILKDVRAKEAMAKRKISV